MIRKTTTKLVQMAEDGLLSWETIARECLAYMSEDDVEDMSLCADMVDSEDDDE